MAVTLTISETLNGADLGDTLLDGGDPGTYAGADLGLVINNQYAPVTDKALNTGHQDIYLHHDGANLISDVKVYLGDYVIETGNPYGGARTSAGDYSQLKTLGQGSGSSKNNADGNSGGLWLDMDADATTTNQFDQANFPSLVKIFGDGGTDGIDAPSVFTLAADAMVYDNTGETVASAPVAGTIGESGNSVNGDNAHLKTRIYIPATFTEGGYYQVAMVFLFSATS